MTLPPGYHREGEQLPINPVCRLHKSLYGLRQASRQWFSKFSATLLEIGFAQSVANHSLFVKGHGGFFNALLVYVDDIVIASNNTFLDYSIEGIGRSWTIKILSWIGSGLF